MNSLMLLFSVVALDRAKSSIESVGWRETPTAESAPPASDFLASLVSQNCVERISTSSHCGKIFH